MNNNFKLIYEIEYPPGDSREREIFTLRVNEKFFNKTMRLYNYNDDPQHKQRIEDLIGHHRPKFYWASLRTDLMDEALELFCKNFKGLWV